MFTEFVNEILVPALIRAFAEIIKEIVFRIDWFELLETVLHWLGM